MEQESKQNISSNVAVEAGETLSAGQFFLEMVKVFLLAAVIIIPVRVLLFQPFFVQGSSMVPNFEDGEYLIVNELGYKETNAGLFSVEPYRELTRQEPIVFRSAQKEGQYLIKRVIGLPGESVEIRDSKVIITNEAHPEGFVLDEREYLADSVVTSDMKKIVLSDDEYFVLGDNRLYSKDSRVFGPIRKESVIGRVLFRMWPFSRVAVY